MISYTLLLQSCQRYATIGINAQTSDFATNGHPMKRKQRWVSPPVIPTTSTLSWRNLLSLTKNYWDDKVKSNPQSLGYMYLAEFPHGIACTSKTLGRLELRRCQLGDIPDELGELTNLRSLVLRDCATITLPRTLGNLTKLRVLDIADTYINGEFPDLSGLTELAVVRFRNCKFDEFPTKLPWSSLRVLDLRECDVAGCGAITLPDMPSLERLNMWCVRFSHGRIVTKGNFPRLQTLDLQGGNLASPPPWVEALPRVTEINLRANNLANFPYQLLYLATIRELDVAFNNLRQPAHIPSGVRVITYNGRNHEWR
jgi:Leucine-rich repeat (LRR) protein